MYRGECILTNLLNYGGASFFLLCRYDVNANGDKFSKFDDIVSQIIEDDSSFYAFNQNLKNLNLSFNQGSNG